MRCKRVSSGAFGIRRSAQHVISDNGYDLLPGCVNTLWSDIVFYRKDILGTGQIGERRATAQIEWFPETTEIVEIQSPRLRRWIWLMKCIGNRVPIRLVCFDLC